MISELCVVAILAEYVEEEGRSFQEPRSFFALCSLLRRALLYQPTYSARRAITEELTYHGRYLG